MGAGETPGSKGQLYDLLRELDNLLKKKKKPICASVYPYFK